MNSDKDADNFRAQLQQLFSLLPDMQNTSTTFFKRLQFLETERCEWKKERRDLLEKHETALRSHMASQKQKKNQWQSEVARKAQDILLLKEQLETANREKADLGEHVAFQARCFAEERIQIHEGAMKEAEQRTSEALRHASKEHSTKLDVQIANLARVQKQADDCQLELAAKEAQVAELQSRLDGVTAQLEGIRHAPNSAAELQQALTAKDAQIAELQSSREASMGYRKLCVTLSQECKNLRAQLQGQGKQPVSSSRLDSDPSTTSTPVMRGDSSAQRHNAADERVHAAEARANEAEYIERENTKQYIIKKRMLIQEMQTALEECKRRMLANGLDFPEINMKPWSQHRQDEEERKSAWDPTASEEAGPASLLHAVGRLQAYRALQPDSTGQRTSFLAPDNVAAASDLPPTDEEASPDDVKCCTVVYKSAGPAEDIKADPQQPFSTPAPGRDAVHARQNAGDNAPSPATPASPQRDVQQPPAQSSEQSDGQQKPKRGVAMCRETGEGCGVGGSLPKRQRTEGVLQDADLNTLVASQDSTDAQQTAAVCPSDNDEAAEAFLSVTQLTMDTRQRRSQAVQEERDSQDNSENIGSTPQSRRWPPRTAAPAQTAAQAADAQPTEAAQAQESAAPGSPAWQLKSREQRAAGKQLAAGEELPSAAEERSAAAAQQEMSLHLSQLQPPTSREPAAPPEPSGRPNPFNRAAQHARAAGARPPPKWNQKQRGPALPDALAFLDLKQTQQPAAFTPQQLPTIVERHADATRAAAEPVPQRSKSANPPQNQFGERGYKYKEVVRKKAEREELTGIECGDCRKFYAAIETWGAVGDLPACGHAVRGAQAGDGATKSGAGAAGPVREQLRQDASRHRYRYEPPATPAGFWDMGFMDSLDSRVQPQNYGDKEDEAYS